ncbi:MAG TPA: helix-turn-helix domain-containing protein [Bacteroidales bacterium]|nr:helix-turn-helix domain-containing protein [Bacteroidales bacterium]
MEKEFLSANETCQIFGIHKNTLYIWIKKRFLVALRIGDKPKSPYRISRKSIEAIHESIIKDLASKASK